MKKICKRIISAGLLLFCFMTAFVFLAVQTKAEEKKVKYEDHTFSNIDTAVKAVGSGYLYGGLYTTSEENGETKYIGVTEPEVGKTYQLKWVPEGILNVQAQVSGTLLDDDTSNDGSASIRFVTTIDDLQYQKIGFKIALEGGKTIDDIEVSKYVHTKLYAVDKTDGDFIAYEPTDIHEAAKYFKTYTIKNVTQEYYDHDFTVTAYWITKDGTRVEGTNTIGIKTVNLGRSWVYVIEPDAIASTEGTTNKNLGTENDPFHSFEKAAAFDSNTRMNIILKSDVPVSSQIAFEDGDDDKISQVTITGYTGDSSDAFTITRDASAAGMFLVGSEQEMIITGKTILDGNSNSTSPSAQAMIVNAGTLTIDSGVTLQNGYKQGSDKKSYFGAADASAGAVESNGVLNINGTVTACGSNLSSAISSQGTVTMNGADISNNQGRVLRLVSGSATIIDSILKSNTCGGNGGAILIIAGTVEATGTTISENTANQTGGAIYMAGAGTLTLTDCTLDGNMLTNTGNNYGGAISLAGTVTRTVTLTGCTISNHKIATTLTDNTKYGARGGALYFQGAGTITLDDCTITGNEATASAYKDEGNLGNGGGIYVYNSCTADIDITDCTITGNKATSEGGGIYVGATACDITIKNENSGGITSNEANRGGGVYTVGTGDITIDDCTMQSNTAKSSGGGIFVSSTTSDMVTLTMNKCNITQNTAAGNGGGVSLTDPDGTLTVSMTDCSITENVTNAPAAPYTGCGAGIFANCAGTLNLTNCNIDDNEANDNADYYTYPTEGNGGGIYLLPDSTISLTVNGGSVSDNKACIGGGLYLANNATHTISDCTISGNETKKRTDTGKASDTKNYSTFFGMAGAIMIRCESNVTLDTCTISNNTGHTGGGIVLMGAGTNTLTMTKCTLNSNTANGNSGGGAMYVDKKGATISMMECKFISNVTTSARGGAIRFEQGKMDAVNCAFDENSAKTSGGALFLNTYYTSSYKGYGCSDGSDTALTTAAPYTLYSDVTLANCTFTDNLVNGTITGTTSNPASAVHSKCGLTLSGSNNFNGVVINTAALWDANSPTLVRDENPGANVNSETYPYGVTYSLLVNGGSGSGTGDDGIIIP